MKFKSYVFGSSKIATMLPFLSQEELKKLAFQVENGEVDDIRIEVIIPFLSEETVKEIAMLRIYKNKSIDVMFPFLSRNSLKEILTYCLENDKFSIVILPFLDEEQLQILLKKSEAGEITSIPYQAMLPFLSRETITTLFHERIEKGKDIRVILPFLARNVVEEAFVNSEDEKFKDQCIPFISKTVVDEEFFKRIKNKQNVKKIAPFVSNDAFHKLVDEYIEGKIDVSFDDIYCFLNSEDIKRIFNEYLHRQRKN